MPRINLVASLLLSLLYIMPSSVDGGRSNVSNISRLNGVSFGGWLLMETSWMYDEFNYLAENDFIQALRNEHNDSYSIQTMKNHWFRYFPEEALDDISEFGIDYVRIPLGYWTFDAPANETDVDHHHDPWYSYGFNPEGFVTGSINALEWMLPQLYQRNMSVLLDLHAPPGVGSKCQSYSGEQLDSAFTSFWIGSPRPTLSSSCGSGHRNVYTSTRSSQQSWLELGLQIIDRITRWIVVMNQRSQHPNIITHLELVNEPGLGWTGMQPTIEAFTKQAGTRAQSILQEAGQSVEITVNFIFPNQNNAGQWVSSLIKDKTLSSALVDYHYYFNWNGPTSMQELLQEVCRVNINQSDWSQYTDYGLPVAIGEWSLASNLDSPSFTNVSDRHVRSFLKQFWSNQMSLYEMLPGIKGQFYWTG